PHIPADTRLIKRSSFVIMSKMPPRDPDDDEVDEDDEEGEDRANEPCASRTKTRAWFFLMRPSSWGRKPNVRTPFLCQLTAVSRPLSPISDSMLRRVRQRSVCLSSIPPS